MTPNKWQLKAAVTGTATTNSDWDGKSLGEIYLTLRRQGDTHRTALDLVKAIKADRLWAMDGSQIPHVSQDQALVWLLEAHVDSYEAVRRVYGENCPKRVYEVVEAVWSKRNAEHRQALEDARMVG